LRKRRAEPFSAYSVLGEGERNKVERKCNVPKLAKTIVVASAEFKEIFSMGVELVLTDLV
jgi:hypothetical protein